MGADQGMHGLYLIFILFSDSEVHLDGDMHTLVSAAPHLEPAQDQAAANQPKTEQGYFWANLSPFPWNLEPAPLCCVK